MRKVIGDGLEVIWICVDVQVVELAESMGRDLEEWVARKQDTLPIQRQFDWGGLRALEVDLSFFRVHTVEISPQ